MDRFPVWSAFVHGLLEPAISLLILFLPILPLRHAIVGDERLLWIPIAIWVAGWLLPVSPSSANLISPRKCLPVIQATLPAVTVLLHVARWIKRLAPRILAQYFAHVAEYLQRGKWS